MNSIMTYAYVRQLHFDREIVESFATKVHCVCVCVCVCVLDSTLYVYSVFDA